MTKVPYEYFLHLCGASNGTVSCGDLKDFYFFSEGHENRNCMRRGGQMTYAGIVGGRHL